MKHFFLALLIGCAGSVSAQTDTSAASVTFNGYAEVYYSYAFNQPPDHARPGFLYSHNRHNEFSLNLGFVKTAYSSERMRANLALAAGTYMNANYAAEAGVMKNIYEANVGYKISRQKNLWIDAGIFGSHIGFESAMSKDCAALTRSILAENSPYYESGAKLTYITDDGKWLFSGLILNGWQHIQRPDDNQTLAWGTQITFSPSAKVTLNSSTFIGNERPGDNKEMRYFHDFYALLKLSDQFHLTAGFDFGMEQVSGGSDDNNSWYSPVLIARVILNDQWSIAGRGELYRDEHGVIIGVTDFETTGFSLNLDCKLRENALWRIEGRMLNSKNEIFLNADGEPSKTDGAITTSIALTF
jgi:hypothetical protein